MEQYRNNPRNEGSGVFTAVPHRSRCPFKCEGCAFNEGRSYLEPLEETLPNVPEPREMRYRVVCINDWHDSSNSHLEIVQGMRGYPLRFFNTIVPYFLHEFDAPVVLTLNAREDTDTKFWQLEEIPANLMFVRFRVNTWNIKLLWQAVDYYTGTRRVPLILDWVEYPKVSAIPTGYRKYYKADQHDGRRIWRVWFEEWRRVADLFTDDILVYTCGRGPRRQDRLCRNCGNCLREYFATRERMLAVMAKAEGPKLPQRQAEDLRHARWRDRLDRGFRKGGVQEGCDATAALL